MACARCGGTKARLAVLESDQAIRSLAMNDKIVPLNLRQSARVPQTIMLPMALVNGYGLNRKFLINAPDQQVPEPLKLWLQGDRRYADLFATEAEALAAAPAKTGKKKAAKAAEPVETPEENGESAEENGENGETKAWNPDWSNADLRAYALENGVELTSADKTKDLIRAALRAGNLPESADATLDGEPDLSDEDEEEALPETEPEA